MKRIFLIVCSFILVINTGVFSQQVFNHEKPFKLLFDGFNKINSYYIGYNPAYLYQDKTDELLTIHSSFDGTSGDYKRFIDPGEINTYELGASGKKVLDSTQIFKGAFGFQRVEYNDWEWLFTKDYSSGNPFLIGNTTTGNTRFNGIVMSAEYSNRLLKDLSVGVSLNYSVDEGLKEVSPRPVSDHRTIDFKLGAGYNITDKLSIGITGNVYDKYEIIKFSQDEGSLTQEVTILKFRGYDFPNVFSKNSETRYSYNNGYLSDFTFNYALNDVTSIAAYAGGGFEKTMIKDDSVNPLPDGFWKNDILRGGIFAVSSPSEKVKLGASYKYSGNKMWSEEPDYESVYMENKYDTHSFTAGVEYSLNDKMNLGIEAGADYLKRKDDDYYSHINSNSNAVRLNSAIGAEIKWSTCLSTLISYGFQNQNINSASLNYGEQSDYFILYRIYDILFYQTDYNKHSVNLDAKIDAGKLGLFNVYVNYSYIKAGSFAGSGSDSRKDFSAVLEYRIKAY